MPYARAIRDAEGQWRFQPLEEHLEAVAQRAADHARCFGGADLARVAGLWHDLGKYSVDFQQYLLDASQVTGEREDAGVEGHGRRVDHSSAGALLALDRLGPVGKILSQIIAAHHHGLYDAQDLVERMARARAAGRLAAAMSQGPPTGILGAGKLDFPQIPGTRDAARPEPLAFSFFLRMLFSCLVDADVLDSEAFADATRSNLRAGFARLDQLKPLFDQHMAGFVPDTPVRRIRARVLADCRSAGGQAPGLYTLSVPTGGGKTLSSMAFALEHALRWGFERVIYVIPYTSIIEQTADVFRSIFGEAVVEHHSNLDSAHETARSRLASENWDAPIVVTTNVQFFESLFAARTSRCRKLHNVLRSVVVLDEAQLLPPAFLQPVVDTLRLLVNHYPATVVLSTATQPVLASRERFGASFRGIDSAHEIVRDPDGLHRDLERVRVHVPRDLTTPTTWEALAGHLGGEPCALVIVNRRADARDLHALLPPGTVHLSGLMCGAHRADTISKIRCLLASTGRDRRTSELRVVSTQLVEAGVDLDFPVVYRAFAGLDSIAQAAGRCNREGALDRGDVHVFVPLGGAPPGILRLGEQAARSVLFDRAGDPLRREVLSQYFDVLYRGCDLDQHGIVPLLRPDQSGGVVGLREASDRFRLIDDDQVAILVPYRRSVDDRTCQRLISALRREGPERTLLRRLQRYTVSLPTWSFKQLCDRREVEEMYPGLWALVSESQYDPTLGLLVDSTARAPVLIA